MRRIMQLAILGGLAVVPGVAATWWGALVNSDCYASMERNINPTDSLGNVDKDRGEEISYCVPKAKTKSFGIVQQDGSALTLDAPGDVKASEFVRKTGKQSRYLVTVTGERLKKTIQVESIVSRSTAQTYPGSTNR